MHLKEDQLRVLLVDSKAIAPEVFESVLVYARETNVDLEQALREKQILTDDQLGEMVARGYNLPFVNLSKVKISLEVLEIIPEEVARAKSIIAFERTGKAVRVAIADPTANLVVEAIVFKTGLAAEKYYATDTQILQALSGYNINLQERFEKLLAQEDKVITTITHDPPVTKMVDLMIEAAYKAKASDIHIEPQYEDFIVRFRVDGMLSDILKLPKRLHDRVITRIKVMADLRTDQHFAAQDGKIKTSVAGERLDLRVSVIPIADGEKVVMRLLVGQAKVLSMSDLGMTEIDLAKVKEASTHAFGMILVTGPTGSGKTTTIYSVLKTINTREKNLTTIEDPIEYHIAGANQVQVNEKTNLTFANGLRSLLRQDPDYIFVGEVRDNETAGIAINASLTGHLVFSTLHTNSAAASLPRLYDMKVEPFLAASTVHLIIAQRLVRRICPHCRVSDTVPIKTLEQYFSHETIRRHYIPVGEQEEVRVYHGQGCAVCHQSGYLGRVGIYEVLKMTKAMRDLVARKANSDEITELALKEGMTTMHEDGIIKITQGQTTIEEILRVTTTQTE